MSCGFMPPFYTKRGLLATREEGGAGGTNGTTGTNGTSGTGETGGTGGTGGACKGRGPPSPRGRALRGGREFGRVGAWKRRTVILWC